MPEFAERPHPGDDGFLCCGGSALDAGLKQGRCSDLSAGHFFDGIGMTGFAGVLGARHGAPLKPSVNGAGGYTASPGYLHRAAGIIQQPLKIMVHFYAP